MTEGTGASHAAGQVEDVDLLLAVAVGVRATLKAQEFILSRLPYQGGDRFSDSDKAAIQTTLEGAGADLDRVLEALSDEAEVAMLPLAGWTDDLDMESRKALADCIGRLMHWQDAEGFAGTKAIYQAMSFVCAGVRESLGGEISQPVVVLPAFLDECETVNKAYPGEGVALMRAVIRGLAIVIATGKGGRLATWFKALAHLAQQTAKAESNG